MQCGESCHGLDRESTPTPGKRHIKIRVSLLFDGTLNNWTNVLRRVEHPTTYRRTSGGSESYDNDFSNVARLARHLENAARGYHAYAFVYTEGIGTTNLGRDDSAGYALGSGPTGIRAKVEQGLRTAAARFARLRLGGRLVVPSRTVLDLVTIDTCGFSRGAAAARHCVHRALHDPRLAMAVQLRALGYEVRAVEVRAVGLFDTVSSHATGWRDGARTRAFYDDVGELQLTAISQAKAVYQLAAAEEYRENFALTNILSAGKKGVQVYLPGAHSDIGGGYRDRKSQEAPRTLATGGQAEPVGNFLIARGWYAGTLRGPELAVTGPLRYLTGGNLVRQRGPTKRSVYTFIPLRLMARWLTGQGLPVRAELFQNYTPDEVPGGAAIEARALRAVDRSPDYWEQPNNQWLAGLRRGFLHVSFHAEASYGVTYPHIARFNPRRNRPERYPIGG